MNKWSKHKKPFISAPGLARVIPSVFLDHLAMSSCGHICLHNVGRHTRDIRQIRDVRYDVLVSRRRV